MSVASGEVTVLTPTVKTFAKRSAFWIAAAIAAVLVAIVSMSLSGTNVTDIRLDPESPNLGGTQALAEVLRSQGVDVVVTTSLRETRVKLGDGTGRTLFFSDPEYLLSDDQFVMASNLAQTVVVADPRASVLADIAPEVASAGTRVGTLSPNCDADSAAQAPLITAGPSALRIETPGAGVVGCYGDDDLGYGLVTIDHGSTELMLLTASDSLTNSTITSADNAAFALSLLGQHETLVWYTPGLSDYLGADEVTLDDLAPDWVLPSVWFTILTLLLAAVWKGRRFGPLVVEKLPVVVRSNETLKGRARLYEKVGARLHTMDALRIGTIRRVAALCGLPHTASVDEVINRIAPLVNSSPAQLRQLLVDAEPATDQELVELSDELLSLEQRVHIAIRPA